MVWNEVVIYEFQKRRWGDNTNNQKCVSGGFSMENMSRGEISQEFRGQNVEKNMSSFQGVRPKRRRKRGMAMKSTNDIINWANFAFGFSILWGSFWTRETQANAMLGTKVMKRPIIKFTPWSHWKFFNRKAKLCENKCSKINKYVIDLRFPTERKCL